MDINTTFMPIDMERWERKEHFSYYSNILETSYHMTVEIDITDFYHWTKEKSYKFFPSFLYVIMRAVNHNKEFRMAYQGDVLGYYEVCHPSYTIFHKDDCTFSDIWTEYNDDFGVFYQSCLKDMETYKDVKGVKTKAGRPENFCPISCTPWVSFTGMGHDTKGPGKMYFPVINFGKYVKREELQAGKIKEKIYIPVAVHVNHAAADGYHTSKLFLDIQKIAEEITRESSVI